MARRRNPPTAQADIIRLASAAWERVGPGINAELKRRGMEDTHPSKVSFVHNPPVFGTDSVTLTVNMGGTDYSTFGGRGWRKQFVMIVTLYDDGQVVVEGTAKYHGGGKVKEIIPVESNTPKGIVDAIVEALS